MKGIVFDGDELRVVEGLEVRDPGPNEVAVRIVNSGVCHSDVSVINGTIPFPTPVVLGHEGAGVVEAVGSAVTNVATGDHVVLSTLGQCGACPSCDAGRPTMCRSTFGARDTPFTLDGVPHHNFANISSFSEHVVVRANQAIKIPDEVPLPAASLIGCGVLTGSGAALMYNRLSHCIPHRLQGIDNVFITTDHDRKCAVFGPHITTRNRGINAVDSLSFGGFIDFDGQRRFAGGHIH